MKVVIDTNVVISAAIADRNPEKIILFVVSNPDYFITGDKDFDEVKNLGHTKIISVSLFQTKYQIK